MTMTTIEIPTEDAVLLAEAYRYSQFSDIGEHGNCYHHGVPERVKQALYRLLDQLDQKHPAT